MRKAVALFSVVLALTAGSALAKEDSATTGTKSAASGKEVGNTHCPVMSNETVGPDSKSVTHKGQTVRVCCKKCIKKFNENPDAYLKKAQEDAAKK